MDYQLAMGISLLAILASIFGGLYLHEIFRIITGKARVSDGLMVPMITFMIICLGGAYLLSSM